MIQPLPERISLADFLAWEQSQEQKHELLAGEILAFSGGSFDHNDISLNVCRLLDDRVTPPCKAHNSDTIIETRARKGESGLRADASVSCSSEDTGKATYMRHPRIVVEVRSPSNVGEQWENKLFEYRETASIEQIVIIESEARSVRSYVRDDEWQWRQEPTVVGDGVLVFRVGVEMTLQEIYRRTSLANEATNETFVTDSSE
jgi:Uma2 family endonuclease